MKVSETLRICPICSREFTHPWSGITYCSYTCARKSRILPLDKRLWSRVEIKGTDECWPWIGFKDHKGYGVFQSKKPRRFAHSIAWEIKNGPIPKGLGILHSCDNPSCCNPNHLRPGTQQQNIQDAVDRQRMRRGSNHPLAKLTEEHVRIIRGMSFTIISTRNVADLIGCSMATVRAIVARKRWKHLP